MGKLYMDYGVLKGRPVTWNNEIPKVLVDRNPKGQVYLLTHNGEGDSLPFLDKAYISFTYGGKKIEDFGLIAVTLNSRLLRLTPPSFEDTVTDYQMLHGQFYWGSKYNARELSLMLFTDGISQVLLDKFKYWFKAGLIRELILALHPNRGILARIKESPQISMVPFQDIKHVILNTKLKDIIVTKYKGSIRLTFVMDDPFWYAINNFLGKVQYGSDGTGYLVDYWQDINGNDCDILDNDGLKIMFEDNIPSAGMIQSFLFLGDESINLADKYKYTLTDEAIENETDYGTPIVNDPFFDISHPISGAIAGPKFLKSWPSNYKIDIIKDIDWVSNSNVRKDTGLYVEALNSYSYATPSLIPLKKGSAILRKDMSPNNISLSCFFYDKETKDFISYIMYDYIKSDGSFLDLPSFIKFPLDKDYFVRFRIQFFGLEKPNINFLSKIFSFLLETFSTAGSVSLNNKDALSLFYSGTAPSLPELGFSVPIVFNEDGYIISFNNSEVPTNTGNTYNTLSIIGESLRDLKITLPSIFSSYNNVIKILKNTNPGRDLVSLIQIFRNDISHIGVRNWIINCINIYKNNKLLLDKINVTIFDDQMRDLLLKYMPYLFATANDIELDSNRAENISHQLIEELRVQIIQLPSVAFGKLQQKISFGVVAKNALYYEWQEQSLEDDDDDYKTIEDKLNLSVYSNVLVLTVTEDTLSKRYRCKISNKNGYRFTELVIIIQLSLSSNIPSGGTDSGGESHLDEGGSSSGSTPSDDPDPGSKPLRLFISSAAIKEGDFVTISRGAYDLTDCEFYWRYKPGKDSLVWLNAPEDWGIQEASYFKIENISRDLNGYYIQLYLINTKTGQSILSNSVTLKVWYDEAEAESKIIEKLFLYKQKQVTFLWVVKSDKCDHCVLLESSDEKFIIIYSSNSIFRTIYQQLDGSYIIKHTYKLLPFYTNRPTYIRVKVYTDSIHNKYYYTDIYKVTVRNESLTALYPEIILGRPEDKIITVYRSNPVISFKIKNMTLQDKYTLITGLDEDQYELEIQLLEDLDEAHIVSYKIIIYENMWQDLWSTYLLLDLTNSQGKIQRRMTIILMTEITPLDILEAKITKTGKAMVLGYEKDEGLIKITVKPTILSSYMYTSSYNFYKSVYGYYRPSDSDEWMSTTLYKDLQSNSFYFKSSFNPSRSSSTNGWSFKLVRKTLESAEIKFNISLDNPLEVFYSRREPICIPDLKTDSQWSESLSVSYKNINSGLLINFNSYISAVQNGGEGSSTQLACGGLFGIGKYTDIKILANIIDKYPINDDLGVYFKFGNLEGQYASYAHIDFTFFKLVNDDLYDLIKTVSFLVQDYLESSWFILDKVFLSDIALNNQSSYSFSDVTHFTINLRILADSQENVRSPAFRMKFYKINEYVISPNIITTTVTKSIEAPILNSNKDTTFVEKYSSQKVTINLDNNLGKTTMLVKYNSIIAPLLQLLNLTDPKEICYTSTLISDTSTEIELEIGDSILYNNLVIEEQNHLNLLTGKIEAWSINNPTACHKIVYDGEIPLLNFNIRYKNLYL